MRRIKLALLKLKVDLRMLWFGLKSGYYSPKAKAARKKHQEQSVQWSKQNFVTKGGHIV